MQSFAGMDRGLFVVENFAPGVAEDAVALTHPGGMIESLIGEIRPLWQRIGPRGLTWLARRFDPAAEWADFP